MAGIRIGGVANIPSFVPFILTDTSTNFMSIWLAAHGQAAYELPNTSVDVFSLAQILPWPSMNRAGDMLLYDAVTQGTQNFVYTSGTDPVSATNQIVLVPAGSLGGYNSSLQPSFSPNGSSVVYRYRTASPAKESIRSCDVDGSNDIELADLSTGDGVVSFPLFSYDGQFILFVQDDGANRIHYVMEADGSNLTAVVTTATQDGFASQAPAWMKGDNFFGYYADSGEYNMIAADGTGDTMLWDDPNPIWRISRQAWLPDDSGMIHVRRIPADPDPEYVLHIIEAAVGSTDLSPEQRSWGTDSPYLPRVFGNRIWWFTEDTLSDDYTIASVALDGSDFTTEFTNTVDQEVVGFEVVV